MGGRRQKRKEEEKDGGSRFRMLRSIYQTMHYNLVLPAVNI